MIQLSFYPTQPLLSRSPKSRFFSLFKSSKSKEFIILDCSIQENLQFCVWVYFLPLCWVHLLLHFESMMSSFKYPNFKDKPLNLQFQVKLILFRFINKGHPDLFLKQWRNFRSSDCLRIKVFIHQFYHNSLF
jgi:hypothetical protein